MNIIWHKLKVLRISVTEGSWSYSYLASFWYSSRWTDQQTWIM